MNDDKPVGGTNRRKFILLGSLAAVTLTAIGVIFVLPAELGIDPTGFGKQSGLTMMANPQASETLERGKKRKGVLTMTQTAPDAEPGVSDHWTHVLGPYEEAELKYTLDEGAAITFAWKADEPLNYDMHAHPFEGGEALTESYAITKSNSQSGRYVAAFSGIHGWHWQNRSTSPVTLTLDASGKINGSKLFNASGEQDRALASSTE